MESSPSRRSVLRLGAIATSGAISGCALDNPDVPGNHLFVENRDSEPYTVTLSVSEAGSGDVVVDNRYRVPGETALQFEGVLEAGNGYEIQIEQQREDTSPWSDDMSVEIESCSDEDPSDKVDVSVLLAEAGPTVVTWPCDRGYTYRERLTYVEPDEHAVATETDG